MHNDEAEAPTSSAQKLALWSDILRDCSARGEHFASNIYDKENYRQIQEIALEMLALASEHSREEIEPLRASIFVRPGAIPVGDAAIIDRLWYKGEWYDSLVDIIVILTESQVRVSTGQP